MDPEDLDRLAVELSRDPEGHDLGVREPGELEEYYMSYRDYAEWCTDAIKRLGWTITIGPRP